MMIPADPNAQIIQLSIARQATVSNFIELIADNTIPQTAREALRQVVRKLSTDQLKLVSNWVGQLIKST